MQENKDYLYKLNELIEKLENIRLELDDKLNYPRAILTLCEEIKSLKKELEALDNEFRGYDP